MFKHFVKYGFPRTVVQLFHACQEDDGFYNEYGGFDSQNVIFSVLVCQ